MPKTIRKAIILNNVRCYMRKRKTGPNTFTYEIRYRKNQIEISACGKTINLAKLNFLKKLKDVSYLLDNDIYYSVPTTFHSFAMYYFENYRKESVAEETFHNDLHRYNKYLKPYFKEKPIKAILPLECKRLLDDILKQGKGKTTNEIHSLMSLIFKSAIAHSIINKSPLAIIQRHKHEHENGKALSYEEEIKLLSETKEIPYRTALAILLYTGLRPNELASATIQGPFIKAINSKRHNKKIEYKLIPIINKLKPYLENGIDNLPPIQLIRRRFNSILSEHKLYDLRTTFYTRCDEYGVAPPARDEFVGHSGGALTNAYRDLPEQYLLKEGSKLNEWR